MVERRRRMNSGVEKTRMGKKPIKKGRLEERERERKEMKET